MGVGLVVQPKREGEDGGDGGAAKQPNHEAREHHGSHPCNGCDVLVREDGNCKRVAPTKALFEGLVEVSADQQQRDGGQVVCDVELK